MSRFAIITTVAVLLILGSLAVLPSPWNFRSAIIIAVVYLIIHACGVAFIRLNFYQTAFCQGSPDQNNIALTFDDGPDPETTEFVLNLLSKNDIRATFFCIGSHAKQFPDIARRIVAEGHAIGNHTMHHQWNTNFMFGKKLETEIELAQEAIQDACETCPKLFRPPMGLTNPHFRKILEKHGMTLIGWTLRPLDLNTKDPEKILRKIVTRAGPGSIILLHDAGQTREFLDTVLTGTIKHAKENDLKFVTITELLES